VSLIRARDHQTLTFGHIRILNSIWEVTQKLLNKTSVTSLYSWVNKGHVDVQINMLEQQIGAFYLKFHVCILVRPLLMDRDDMLVDQSHC
jgi:hypothetical protein